MEIVSINRQIFEEYSRLCAEGGYPAAIRSDVFVCVVTDDGQYLAGLAVFPTTGPVAVMGEVVMADEADQAARALAIQGAQAWATIAGKALVSFISRPETLGQLSAAGFRDSTARVLSWDAFQPVAVPENKSGPVRGKRTGPRTHQPKKRNTKTRRTETVAAPSREIKQGEFDLPNDPMGGFTEGDDYE